MNIKLFGNLIQYVAHKEESSYKNIWGVNLLGRLLGKSKTFSDISLLEAKNTSECFDTIKSKISERENLDDILLLCERGVKKYEETGVFFKWFRIIVIASGLLLVQAINFNGDSLIDRERGESKATVEAMCVPGENGKKCRGLEKESLNENIEKVISDISRISFIFLFIVAFVVFLIIAIISNDNKGRIHLEILALYINRLKQERDSKNGHSALV
jgi:hypothetical protein